MKLLPRRTPADSLEQSGDVELDADVVPGSKGRPTPKRRDSVPQRGPVTAPKTRKEAYARQKQQSKAARATRKSGTQTQMTAQERRAALRSGDPALLPRRDQGQTRKLARDYVDSHRMLSNFLLLLFPILIGSSFVPVLAAIAPVALAVIIVEWYFIGRRIRTMAVERFGKAEGGAMSIGFYAGSRAYLPRRWRLPTPQVSRGDTI
ncbi:MAG: hypothetical protein QOG80_2618 [Pseudonocardiales bacterium]|nr:hypothetical protein [Pseudonocardiales bacterium]